MTMTSYAYWLSSLSDDNIRRNIWECERQARVFDVSNIPLWTIERNEREDNYETLRVLRAEAARRGLVVGEPETLIQKIKKYFKG